MLFHKKSFKEAKRNHDEEKNTKTLNKFVEKIESLSKFVDSDMFFSEIPEEYIKYYKHNPWSKEWIISAFKVGQYNRMLWEYVFLVNKSEKISDVKRHYENIETLIDEGLRKPDFYGTINEIKDIAEYEKNLLDILNLNKKVVYDVNFFKGDKLIRKAYDLREKIEAQNDVREVLINNNLIRLYDLNNGKSKMSKTVKDYLLFNTIFDIDETNRENPDFLTKKKLEEKKYSNKNIKNTQIYKLIYGEFSKLFSGLEPKVDKVAKISGNKCSNGTYPLMELYKNNKTPFGEAMEAVELFMRVVDEFKDSQVRENGFSESWLYFYALRFKKNGGYRNSENYISSFSNSLKKVGIIKNDLSFEPLEMLIKYIEYHDEIERKEYKK